jgi:hypothetical protein
MGAKSNFSAKKLASILIKPKALTKPQNLQIKVLHWPNSDQRTSRQLREHNGRRQKQKQRNTQQRGKNVTHSENISAKPAWAVPLHKSA